MTAFEACHAQVKPAAQDPADLILRGGDIVTMDARRPRVRALAVRGDRIVMTGEDDAVMALAGPGTRVIDLAGRTVLPALTDAHAHLPGLGQALEDVDLRGCAQAAECAERVRKWMSERPGSDWILGRGWDQNRFPDKRFPDHAALDAVAPERPVWLRRVDGHAGWANAKALELAGVTAKTAEPAGGRIERGARGEPTGVLVDGATELVERSIPEPSPAARERAILRAQEEALKAGLTEIHDMGIGRETARIYAELVRAGRLRLRIYAMLLVDARKPPPELSTAPAAAAPFAMFTMRGIKLYSDGALGSRGAALLKPYADDPKNSGLETESGADLERASKQALASGWQVAVHAIGDRANRTVLDAFERAGCSRARDHRFRIEHAQIVAPEDIPRFARLGVIASMQPTHATSDMPWAEARLGPRRLEGAYAWRHFLASGAHLAFGSDFPVEDVEPQKGLYAAVTRTDAKGQPPGGWLPSEKLTFEEAVRAFTAEAAYAAFEEGWRGRAAPGQAADLTVFDRPLGGAPQALLSAAVSFTIVGGRVVFAAP